MLAYLLGFSFVALLAWAVWQGAQSWARKNGHLDTQKPCDVLVLGATPAGIAAAIAAARQGSQVTLVEERAQVGGDIRFAMLNMFDVPMQNSQAIKDAENGIFGEFYGALGVAFSIERAGELFDRKLRETPNLRLLKSTKVRDLVLEEGRLLGARLQSASGREETLTAPAIVDASDDADHAAGAGAGYYVGREVANPDRKMQSAGLLFSVQGVDWAQVQRYIRRTKSVSLRRLKRTKRGEETAIDVRIEGRRAQVRMGGGVGDYAYEFGQIAKEYEPKGPDIELLSINMGRQSDGSVVLNTLNITGVDGLSPKSKLAGREQAVRELPALIEFLREEMPGFGRATLDQIAPELYIRETRHIHGFATLEVEDVRADRAFPDRIAKCSYALDLHPYQKGDQNPFGPERHEYTLPLRALVPRHIDGVFVASRSLSATYSAAGSARVIPITMAAGQAAGTAASLCAKSGVTPHGLVGDKAKVSQLQDLLRAAGLDIGDKLVK